MEELPLGPKPLVHVPCVLARGGYDDVGGSVKVNGVCPLDARTRGTRPRSDPRAHLIDVLGHTHCRAPLKRRFRR